MEKLRRNEIIAIGIALAVVAYFFLFQGNNEEVVVEQAENATSTVESVEKINNNEPKATKIMTGATELQIKIEREGQGEPAQTGDTVTVHYTGKLLDGTIFDSSIPRGTPFEFRLGEGRVIAGWEEGVKGMKVGEMRVLTIPGNMAYGTRGIPNGKGGFLIPPNATLVFDVELLGIK
ncbi:MAG TPA: FKBP-type peptidyl-prolyl cis-trans isomerase [Candidatus Paceibacterota bacterium]|nr:FKBP-type peptidyl-prolyl cis-trans isomerase [Candidatus Paceibacterota bacterium]